MNDNQYSELVTHLDTLEHAAELLAKQIVMLRARVESVAFGDEATPQKGLPIGQEPSRE